MSGGPDSIKGIYYQVMISVERILMMLSNYEIDHIVLEAKGQEEEDINIFYNDDRIVYEQVKTKKRGVWSFNEFFKKVFPNFLKLLKSSSNLDLITFRFITNAPPDTRLESLFYDIKLNVTEEEFLSQIKKIKRISARNLDLICKITALNVIEVLKRFEPYFSYFSSENPNQPEKYIRRHLEQLICLDCGKTMNDAITILFELHHFAFEKPVKPLYLFYYEILNYNRYDRVIV